MFTLQQNGQVVCDNCEVPGLTGTYISKTDSYQFTLDKRFGIDVPAEFAAQVVWFAATAMALGAGFTCFGENSQPRNPYKQTLEDAPRTTPTNAKKGVDVVKSALEVHVHVHLNDEYDESDADLEGME
jgi:hypothetical protein